MHRPRRLRLSGQDRSHRPPRRQGGSLGSLVRSSPARVRARVVGPRPDSWFGRITRDASRASSVTLAERCWRARDDDEGVAGSPAVQSGGGSPEPTGPWSPRSAQQGELGARPRPRNARLGSRRRGLASLRRSVTENAGSAAPGMGPSLSLSGLMPGGAPPPRFCHFRPPPGGWRSQPAAVLSQVRSLVVTAPGARHAPRWL
ncbi:uncharacterized protein LOC132652988 [Meriones unguiculatus]|uniref:uncharacterized protein LOC132652988 n=1 Tax=Meriones unguiculatus TaxID=10047 RepID=UPI00293EB7C2|nr:uncharacterized protein LOC132652988 [Meriones unguiculatus]